MKEVTAFEDSVGRLHKSKRDAIDSDFISMIQAAWGKMPDQRDRGDPVVIARILAADHYRAARAAIRNAIAFLDNHLEAIDCPAPPSPPRPPSARMG